MEKIIIFAVLIMLLFFSSTGCQSTEAARIDALVEARLINERERIRAEVAGELGVWINEDFRVLSESLARLGAGQDVTRRAAEEYRAGYLRILDRIEEIAGREQ